MYFQETYCLYLEGPGGLPLVWRHTPKNRALNHTTKKNSRLVYSSGFCLSAQFLKLLLVVGSGLISIFKSKQTGTVVFQLLSGHLQVFTLF
jgi:hypothetical protein